MNKNNSKKGFFFVFVVFLIISYMLASVSITVKQIGLSEKRFSERFKNSNIELVMGQVNDKKIGEVTKSIAYAMLFKLNEQTIETPLKSGSGTGPEAELSYFRAAMEELVANGTAAGDDFEGNPSSFNSHASSLSDWAGKLNDTLEKIGFKVSEFSVSNFWINQSSQNSVDYHLTLHLKVEEKGGLLSITRDYNISDSLSIQAFNDPALAREVDKSTTNPDLHVKKPFYFYSSYQNPASLKPNLLGSGSEGQGWFYGYLVSASDASNVQPFEQNKYILVGTYNEISSNPDFGSFGAYILTNKPGEITSGCSYPNQENTFNQIKYDNRCNLLLNLPNHVNAPFMVYEGFTVDRGVPCETSTSQGKKCLLFVAKSSPGIVSADPTKKKDQVSVYDVEKLRDFALCGYYTYNKNAPSYLQRLLGGSYGKSSPFGIESFVLGNFIGGNVNDDGTSRQPEYSDAKSRLDSEFVNGGPDITKIRGMPGCKDAITCNDNSETLLGHFRISRNTVNRYLGSTDITCKTGASCD